jgi:hypothetical protein
MRPIMMFVLPFLWNGTATAQETTGDLRGRVVSPALAGVNDARIVATGPHLQGTRWSGSNADGVFHLLALPPGSYTLRITAIGYRPLVVRDAPVQLGRTTGLGDLQLESSAIELTELTVTAPRVTLDPVGTTVGATLVAEDYEALPGERDYKSLIAILPHVNTSYHGDPVNVGGGTGLENVYFIDGVNVTSTLKATTGTSLPYNFVRMVEVKAGGYEAQYGKALGAVVNAVTYSGTNEHEANTFAFITHSALAAGPRAEPSLREASGVTYDIGARVSGPILRDRLWYSAAYNPRLDRIEKEIPGHGLHTDRRTAHLIAGKLTWQATPRASVELSVFGDPTVQHEVAVPFGTPTGATVLNPDPFLSRLESGGVVGSLRTTLDLGRIRLESALSRTSGRETNRAETAIGATEAYYRDDVAGAVGGGLFLERRVDEKRTAASLRSSAIPGRHTLTVGAEYEDNEVASTLSHPGIGGIARRDTSTFVVTSEFSTGTFHNRVPTAYVQDAWRVTDRLTLNAGLRWSAQLFTSAAGQTVQRFPDEWQPRLGFSWQLGRSGRQRLFGSYGRFYQQEPLNFPTFWYVDYYFVQTTYSSDPRQPGAPVVDSFVGTTKSEDWARQIDGLEVENFHEFTLGYERLVGPAAQLTIRGIRRVLGSSWQWGADPSNPRYWVIGTPGKGDFGFLPPPKREYTALELAVEGHGGTLAYRVSYVLSRTWGNYTGLFESDAGFANPGSNLAFSAPDQAKNSTGLLPNDRPHVVKLAGSYRSRVGLSIGTFFTLQSGTPVNEFAPGIFAGPVSPVFLVPRGSAGRTPSIWDLNLRFGYDVRWDRAARGRVVLDLLHVGNPRTAVRLDELRFRTQGVENPAYLQPLVFQPPMRARLGAEFSF